MADLILPFVGDGFQLSEPLLCCWGLDTVQLQSKPKIVLTL